MLAGVNPPQQDFSLYLDASLNVACLLNNVGGLYFTPPEDGRVKNCNVLPTKACFVAGLVFFLVTLLPSKIDFS